MLDIKGHDMKNNIIKLLIGVVAISTVAGTTHRIIFPVCQSEVQP